MSILYVRPIACPVSRYPKVSTASVYTAPHHRAASDDFAATVALLALAVACVAVWLQVI